MKSIGLFCCLLAALPCSVSAQAHSPSALAQSTQMIVVTTSGWDAIDGRLQLYQRSGAGDSWSAVGKPFDIVVGKKGMGWGAGAVPMNAASSPGDPVKHEGDRKAPAGIFPLGTTFGYAAGKPDGWKMPYLALTASTDCVDDSHSRFYNRIVERSSVSVDWNSAEHMHKAGEAYRWGIEVDQNMNPARAEGGSCVFVHIWGGRGVGTVGCTAMPAERIQSILAWLDPAAKPLLVQMPAQRYQKIEKAFHLPPPPSN
jgi:L,D-peptidoglycan transpeptidase YkuD (ErfK/YbiS/YcfS/YnhG family)